MTIERYNDKYYPDIVSLITNFYNEALKQYDSKIDMAAVDRAITTYKDSAYLLVVDGKCEGVLAGIEVTAPINDNRVFQEVIWYVNDRYRKYGVLMLKRVCGLLKKSGFTSIIMACMDNSKRDKLFEFYNRMGFVPIEYHFIRSL